LASNLPVRRSVNLATSCKAGLKRCEVPFHFALPRSGVVVSMPILGSGNTNAAVNAEGYQR
jgi:hypothetical protein